MCALAKLDRKTFRSFLPVLFFFFLSPCCSHDRESKLFALDNMKVYISLLNTRVNNRHQKVKIAKYNWRLPKILQLFFVRARCKKEKKKKEKTIRI